MTEQEQNKTEANAPADKARLLAELRDQEDANRELMRALTSEQTMRKAREPHATPNGYDSRWIDCINQVLEDRDSSLKISDITAELWDTFIGPMIDDIQQAHGDEDSTREKCNECGTIVIADDPYFATPCGTYCGACMEDKHSKACGICAHEFDLDGDADEDV